MKDDDSWQSGPRRLQQSGTHSARARASGADHIIHQEGHRLIIEPAGRRSLLEVLDSLEPLQEGLPEIADMLPDEVLL